MCGHPGGRRGTVARTTAGLVAETAARGRVDERPWGRAAARRTAPNVGPHEQGDAAFGSNPSVEYLPPRPGGPLRLRRVLPVLAATVAAAAAIAPADASAGRQFSHPIHVDVADKTGEPSIA